MMKRYHSLVHALHRTYNNLGYETARDLIPFPIKNLTYKQYIEEIAPKEAADLPEIYKPKEFWEKVLQ